MKRLVTIFEKYPNRSESNKLKNHLYSVNEALQNTFKGTSMKRATTQGQHHFKDIKLKWRNFVDDD